MRALLVVSLVLCGCAPSIPRQPMVVAGAPPPSAGAAPSATLAEEAPCAALPSPLGYLDDERLDEISGLVESRATPGVFFAHNDSGDSARFFALNRAGHILASLVLETVPVFVDAEDIALGPAPGGASFLYLGDTGNNFASSGIGIPRRKAVIYRLPEPQISPAARNQELSALDVFPIVLTFPDGARNVEAFVVDPVSGELTMLSKESDGQTQLLTADAAMLAAGGGRLRLAGGLRFGREPLPGNPMPTGASISRDGSQILVRTYSSVFLFQRSPGESVTAALSRAPKALPSPKEPQGEAISFADQDRVYITISEGTKAAINCARIQP